jgi:hypothetical protein
MSVIVSTSGRLHSEFVCLLFLQAHRETYRFFACFRSSACVTWPSGQGESVVDEELLESWEGAAEPTDVHNFWLLFPRPHEKLWGRCQEREKTRTRIGMSSPVSQAASQSHLEKKTWEKLFFSQTVWWLDVEIRVIKDIFSRSWIFPTDNFPGNDFWDRERESGKGQEDTEERTRFLSQK